MAEGHNRLETRLQDTVQDGTGPGGTMPDGTGPEGTQSDGTESDVTGPDGTDSDGTESDGTGSDGTESDETVSDGTESDGTESDGTESDGTESDGTESDGTESDGTESDGKGPDGTESDGTDSDGTEQEGTGPDGTGPDGTGPDDTGPDGTGPDGTGPDGTGPDDGKEKEQIKRLYNAMHELKAGFSKHIIFMKQMKRYGESKKGIGMIPIFSLTLLISKQKPMRKKKNGMKHENKLDEELIGKMYEWLHVEDSAISMKKMNDAPISPTGIQPAKYDENGFSFDEILQTFDEILPFPIFPAFSLVDRDNKSIDDINESLKHQPACEMDSGILTERKDAWQNELGISQNKTDWDNEKMARLDAKIAWEKEKKAWEKAKKAWEISKRNKIVWDNEKKAWVDAKKAWEKDKKAWEKAKKAWENDKESWRQEMEAWKEEKEVLRGAKDRTSILLEIKKKECKTLKTEIYKLKKTGMPNIRSDEDAQQLVDFDPVLSGDALDIKIMDKFALLLGIPEDRIPSALLHRAKSNNSTTPAAIEDESITAIHYVSNCYIKNHYVVSCQRNGQICLYDSLFDNQRIEQVLPQLKLLYDVEKSPWVEQWNVQYEIRACNVIPDCGLFAAAHATLLIKGKVGLLEELDRARLRAHLHRCLKDGKVILFPTVYKPPETYTYSRFTDYEGYESF